MGFKFEMRATLACLLILALPAMAIPSSDPSIFSGDKIDRSTISGEKYRSNQNIEVVFSGRLDVQDLQVAQSSIKGYFLVANYQCKKCRHPDLQSVLITIEDDQLQSKLELVRQKRDDEFGELIRLKSSKLQLFTSSKSYTYQIDCWAETKSFHSQRLNSQVNGYSLACDRDFDTVHVWGEAVFLP